MSKGPAWKELRIRTGLAEFDALFDGGLRVPPRARGIVAIVAGEPGAGKTTLALQILTSLLSNTSENVPRPTLGAYWSFDQPADTQVDDVLDKFALRNQSFVVREVRSRDIPPDVGRQRNLLVVRDELFHPRTQGPMIPGEMSDPERLASLVRERLAAVSKQKWEFVVFVLDGLSSFGKTVREDLQTLLYPAREHKGPRLLAILIDESGSQGPSQIDSEYFLADIVVRLGTHFPYPTPHRERFIEVEKARYQHHMSGKHQIRFERGHGIVIYPSLAGELERIEQPLPKTRPDRYLRTGIEDLDHVLGGEGLAAGSSTLLIGPPGARKTPIALHFLAEEMRTHEAPPDSSKDNRRASDEKRGRGLLLLLRHQEESLFGFLQQYPALSILKAPTKACAQYLAKVRVLERKLNTARRGVRPREEGARLRAARAKLYENAPFQFRTLPARFDSASLLLRRIMDLAKESRCELLVVDDLGRLLRGFPLVREEADEFVAVLVESLRAMGITSVFLKQVPEGVEGKRKAPLELSAHMDNVISLSWREIFGIEKLALEVEESLGSRHQRGLWELCCENGNLKLRPSFEGFTKLRSATPEPVGIALQFYSETSLQQAYHKDQVQIVTGAFGGERVHSAHFGPGEATDIYRSILLRPRTPSRRTIVTMVDEYWVYELARRGCLLDLSPFMRGRERKFIRLAEKKARRNGRLYAIPYFVNFGVFCYRKDLLFAAGYNRPPATWVEALKMADAVVAAHPQEKLVKLDFDRRAAESSSVMMLELLFASNDDARKRLSDATGSAPDRGQLVIGEDIRLADKRNPAFVDTLYTFRRLVNQELLMQGKPCSPKAIFYRHWFTTLAEMIEESSELRDSMELAWLPVAKDGMIRGSCFAGEWYLAIPASSACPEIGWDIVADLTTSEMDRERFQRGAGLPAQDLAYRVLRSQRNPRFCAHLGSIEDFHKSTLTRLAIANYREVSSHLALRFREILLFPLLASEKDEKRRLFEILRDTEKVLLGLRGA